MKKIFILAVAALSLAACGNKSANDAAAEQAGAETQSVEATADSLAAVMQQQLTDKNATSFQSTIEAVKTQYEALVKEGKVEEAAAYASKVKTFITEHAEEIKTISGGNATINSIVTGLQSLPTSAEETVGEGVDAVKADANQVKEAAEQTVDNAKEAAKQTVTDAKNAAETKAKEAVDNAKQDVKKKANDAVNNALNKALGN